MRREMTSKVQTIKSMEAESISNSNAKEVINIITPLSVKFVILQPVYRYKCAYDILRKKFQGYAPM